MRARLPSAPGTRRRPGGRAGPFLRRLTGLRRWGNLVSHLAGRVSGRRRTYVGVPIMPACMQACSASAAWHAHVHGRGRNSQQRALLPLWLVRNQGMGRGCVIVLVDGMIALEYSPTCILRLFDPRAILASPTGHATQALQGTNRGLVIFARCGACSDADQGIDGADKGRPWNPVGSSKNPSTPAEHRPQWVRRTRARKD